MTRSSLWLAAATAALLTAACGGSDDAETPTEEAPAEEAAAEETTEGTPADNAELALPETPDPLAEINKEKSAAFLAENAARDGVRVLDNGLQIETLEAGDGAAPVDGDMLRFHFTGTLADGTILQDSRGEEGDEAEPLVVPSPIVPQLDSWRDIPIPALPEALAEMNVGDRVRVVVPPELAYGAEGVPGAFGPYETLVYDVALIETVAAENAERREEITATQQEILDEARAEQEAAREAAREAYEAEAQANMEASQTFLSNVITQDGVEQTPSGLAFEVLEDGGEGDTPAATDVVTVHYTGTLPDGTVFDSSRPDEGGEPISFGLDQVIPGWTEGVALMNVGDTYKFYIPSELAYGERGTPGGPIGPNQALVFEVELLGIETPEDTPPGP